MALTLRKSSIPEKTDDELAKEDALSADIFRRKVAIQQFMNHNGPLFRAFARAGTSIDEMVEGEVLRKPASLAMDLAKRIASKVLGKPLSDLTAADISPFRGEAAEYVATRFSVSDVDTERAAEEIAAAVNLADHSWDHDVYRDDKLSDDASLMISAVSGAGRLAELVNIYDFRHGRDEAFSKIGREVVETAAKTAQEMLPETRSSVDIRNLTQTLMRNLSTLMAACYDRKAREVITYLNGKPEREIVDWYKRNAPLDEIIRDFKDWTICFAGYAVAASKEMKHQKRPDPDISDKFAT